MDIERAKAIKMSADWEEICKEIDTIIQSKLNQTRVCLPENLVRLQAEISTYEGIKNLPQNVIDRAK